jgi:hypothetical protein
LAKRREESAEEGKEEGGGLGGVLSFFFPFLQGSEKEEEATEVEDGVAFDTGAGVGGENAALEEVSR